MAVRLTPLFLLGVLCVVSCDSPQPPITSSDSIPITKSGGSLGTATITGNWELTYTSTQSPNVGQVFPAGVYFLQSGTTASGTAIAQTTAAPCSLSGALSGTVDASGNFTLTSSSGLSISGQLSTSGTLSGSYSFNVESCTDRGNVTGTWIPSITGTYAGNVVSTVSGATQQVVAVLTQSSTPYASGTYLPLTGGVTFSPPCCNVTTIASGGYVIGNEYAISIAWSGATRGNATGTISPDAKTLSFNYAMWNSYTNTFDYGSGTLTRQ